MCFRVEQDQDLKTKVATIEDLHQRLKCNIENIQQLNTQVKKKKLALDFQGFTPLFVIMVSMKF